MNALAKDEVGDYLGKFFVSTYQRVGTFEIVGNKKKGGNVASYFCLPDKRVVHVIPGPVGAQEFVREARWAVELTKHAALVTQNRLQLQALVRKAHLERLQAEHGVNMSQLAMPLNAKTQRHLNKSGKVHQLLAANPLPELGTIYGYVFEKILKEEISTLPVAQR